MATTTNYGWETPDDTDLVKDGALAQRTTASAIDTSLFSITNGKNVSISLVGSASLSGVASASIANCFTSDYSHYLYTYQGAGTVNGQITVYLQLRTGTTNQTSDYITKLIFTDVAGANSSWAGYATSSGQVPIAYAGNGTYSAASGIIYNPNIATRTSFTGTSTGEANGAYIYGGQTYGYHNTATAYPSITIGVNSGTLTGNLRIYGIRNS